MKERRKRDLILIGIVFLALLVVFLIWRGVYSRPGTYCEITVDGVLKITAPLSVDREIPIQNRDQVVTNTLKIEGGKAKMIDAACPDHLCMHQKAIDRDGETIVCLPNRVVVTVRSEEESSFDAVAG